MIQTQLKKEKIVLPPFTALLGHPVQNILFLDIINFFGTPLRTKRKFQIWGVGYQNRVKTVFGVNF